MNPLNIFKIIASFFLVLSICSCKKYLDKKSDQKLSTPSTLKDLQALLDNQFFYRRGIRLANTSSDEYYTLYTNWQSLSEPNKNGYVWDAQVNDLIDWQNQYNNIYYI
jgi:starch-binding outer membrane protein, SusD/RagB family